MEETSTALLSFPRLKDTVEMLETIDGAIYLMPPSGHNNFHFPEASDADRAFLHSLDGTRSVSAISEDIARRYSIPAIEVAEGVAELAKAGLLEDTHATMANISPDTRSRYDRQIEWFKDCVPYGTDAGVVQQRLSASHVGIIGLGGAGLNVAMGLIGIGVGRLTLIDGDKVELSNLPRQLLFTESDVGANKAQAGKSRLQERYGSCDITAIDAFVEEDTDLAALLSTCTMVVNAADTPVHAIGRWVAKACDSIAVPFMTMSQFPPVVRIGPLFLKGRSGCLDCYENPTAETFPYFAELVKYREFRGPVAAATAPGCMLIGSLTAHKLCEYLSGISSADSLLGKAWVIDLTTMEIAKETVEPIDGCLSCGHLAETMHEV